MSHSKTVRFALSVDGIKCDDIEFDIVDGQIRKCFFDGTNLKEWSHNASWFNAIVSLCGGENEILSRSGDPVDDIQEHKDRRAI